jgi:uncharacterized Zn-binding protein involved in type VI secretion
MPAARVTDLTAHGSPLSPGPGAVSATTVLIGGLPAWRGLPAAAAAALNAAKQVSDAAIKVAESATMAAAGTPGAPAAYAAEVAAKTAAGAALGALASGLAGASTTPSGGMPDMHMCPMPSPPTPVPHGVGYVIDGSTCVLTHGLPQCALGDTVLEAIGPPNKIVKGEFTVLIGKGGAGGGLLAGIAATIQQLIDKALEAAKQLAKDIAAVVQHLVNAVIDGIKGMVARLTQAVVDAITNALNKLAEAFTPKAKTPREELLDRIKSGNSNLKVEGTDEYKEKVYKNLDTLSQSPTGLKLLESLDKSDNTTTIKATEPGKGNTETAENFNDGLYDTANGKPGPGTNTTVSFDPDRKKINGEDWMTRDPAIGLGHELIHAHHDVNGTTATPDDVDYVDADGNNASAPGYELQTVGLGPYKDNELTENKIRQEFEDGNLGENDHEHQRPAY